jgi:hypothetical protein
MAFLKVWVSRFMRLSGNYEKAQNLLEEVQTLIQKARASGYDVRLVQAHLYREWGDHAGSRNLKKAYHDTVRGILIFQTLDEPWWLAKMLSKLIRSDDPVEKLLVELWLEPVSVTYS